MRANWRERDLRGGDGGAPSSVRAVVERTRFGIAAARAGESALLGLSAAAVTLAAISFDAPGPISLESVEVWIVALVSGLACGFGWHREHLLDDLQVARKLDQRLRHQGGLITAFEMEAEPEPSPMGRLLIRRVLHRLRLKDALRSMFPSLAIPVAAPIFGVGLLALALEHGRSREEIAADVPALAVGAADVLELLEAGVLEEAPESEEGGGSKLDAAESAGLRDVARRARALSRKTTLLKEKPELAREELADLDRSLADLASRLADRPELRNGLEEARNWIDAAKQGIGTSRVPRPDPEALEGGEEGPEGRSSAQEAGLAVTDSSTEGTMSGSPGGAETNPDDVPQLGSTTENDPGGELGDLASAPGNGPVDVETWTARDGGATGGSYWPAEYDGVVNGWLELTRKRTTRR